MSVTQLAAMIMLSVWTPKVASCAYVMMDFQEMAPHVKV